MPPMSTPPSARPTGRCAGAGARSRRPSAAGCSCGSPMLVAAHKEELARARDARRRQAAQGIAGRRRRRGRDAASTTPVRPTRWRARPSRSGPTFVDFTLHGAARRHRPHRALELPARHGDPLAGAGARRRLHGGAQARRAVAAHRAAASPSSRAEVGLPAGRAQRRHRLSARRRARRWSAIRWCAAITFTGSVETGRRDHGDGGRAAPKPVVLELGGKNPVLVFADADLDRLVGDVADGAFGNAGQVCSSCSRAPGRGERSPTSWSSGSRARAGADHGRPGPRRSRPRPAGLRRAARAQVAGYLDEARRDGARSSTAAAGPADLPRGYFVAPTIFDRVDPRPASRARRSSARSSTRHPLRRRGRGAAPRQRPRLRPRRRRLHPRHLARPAPGAATLEAGSVWINGWFIGGQQAPTGGIKDSGIGRERGLPGVRNYLQIKNVGIRL